MNKGPSANLDFLRAVAVLLVFGQHISRRLLGTETTTPISYLGLFGVLLFFVHTSLVLMYSMERSGLQGKQLVRDFYIRRAFRIYPLSILTIAVALALHLDSNVNGIAGLSYGARPSVKAALAQFLLVQNLIPLKSIVNVLWSLPFEVQMYLFLPFIFAIVSSRRRLWSLLAFWVASFLVAWGQPRVWWLYHAPLLRFVPCFLPGVIAYILPRKAVLRSYLWPLLIAGLIVVYTAWPGELLGGVLCLILGLSIPLFGEIRSPWLRIVANRIATYSYGIYLSHQFCIWFALEVLARYSTWVKASVLIGSLVLLPIVLYHTIEHPMIRLGVRLAASGRIQTLKATTPSEKITVGVQRAG